MTALFQSMKFCETCGNILVVKVTEESRSLFCRKCNKSLPLIEDVTIDFSYEDNNKEVAIVDENDSEFPTTKILCPKCNDMVEAFWAMQQTRSGDEPPTKFYQCKVCKHRWRDYS